MSLTKLRDQLSHTKIDLTREKRWLSVFGLKKFADAGKRLAALGTRCLAFGVVGGPVLSPDIFEDVFVGLNT